VLDDSISSSHSHAGQTIHAHLRDPIVVAGRVIAPAGTHGLIGIQGVSPADIGDVYGYVDIYYEPLVLPDGRSLPLRPPSGRLVMNVSAGHESTVGWEDNVGDIVIPYHVLYHFLRKGKNFVLEPGAQLPAKTEATIAALPNGTIAIETPEPVPVHLNVPKATFPVEPIATPYGPNAGRFKTPKPPSPAPSAPSASPASSPSPSPQASSSPAPSTSPSP
jgi:hypothetical protein